MKRLSLKARLKARRERNRQLAIEDAKHRCLCCKRELGKVVYQAFGDRRQYCSLICQEEGPR